MKPRRFEQHRSKSSMMCNRFSDFNVKSDKGKTPLIVLRCADNRQLFEGTGKGNGKAMKYAIYEGNLDRLEKKLKRIFNKCKALVLRMLVQKCRMKWFVMLRQGAVKIH